MTPESVMTMGRQAMEVTLLIAAPMLITALLIGLLVSIFQAATQINEMTLSFIPKILGVCVVVIVGGPWMVSVIVDYTTALLQSLPLLVR